jgi:hypothetical protein
MRVIDPCSPASAANPIFWRKAYNAYMHLYTMRHSLHAEGCLASTTTEDAHFNKLLRMWANYGNTYLKAPPEPSSTASSGPPTASPSRAARSGLRRMCRSPDQ